MNKKALFCATVDIHFDTFHLPYFKSLKQNGWEIHVAANGQSKIQYVDKKYDLPIQRSPFKIENFKAYIELKKIIKNNKYRMIHCHTPMGGVLARAAARIARHNGTKVLYTAHGFHFFNGAPVLNWLLYYPVERWLARYTDCLITINDEDYCRAVEDKFKACQIERIFGIGVDLNRFKPVTQEVKAQLRRKYGYGQDDFILINVGELNKNKNQDMLIKAMVLLKDMLPNIKLLIAGEGPLKGNVEDKVKQLGLSKHIEFLGYRTDIPELLAVSDVLAAVSMREGLAINVLEALASGLPVVATCVRGQRELIKEGKNGFLVKLDDVNELARYIYETININHTNIRETVMAYSLENSVRKMQEIYDLV